MAKRPNQRRLFRELAAKFGPEVAAAFIAAINDLASGVEFQRLESAVRRGDLQDAIDALHIDRAAFLPLENKIIEAYEAGGQAAVSSMPRAVSIGFRFDPGNQRAAEIIRRTAATLVSGLVRNEVDQARAHLAAGMARGASPRSVALDLVGRINRVTGERTGGMLGLSAPQRAAAQLAREQLRSGNANDLRAYLTRRRRDRRFDRSVERAIKAGGKLDAASADNALTAYRRRLLMLRGEVIARTEGLPAIRAAKHEAYQQLVDTGRIQESDIERTWIATGDGRVRDTHKDMGSQSVQGLSLPFRSPSGALLRYPGDQSLGAPASEIISCRCDESVAIKRQKE